MDEVDQIVAAWGRERPDIDASPMEVFSRIARLGKHLNLMRKEAFTEHGLETWEFDVLSALRRSGPPYELAPGQLVAATMVTSGTMTNRVDRLVNRGLVLREPSLDDRRGVRVILTDSGLTRVDAAIDRLLALERNLLERLPQEQREQLTTALRQLTLGFTEPNESSEQ
ncbi:MAG: winged helix-turn-helix transcriptional regulator [Actinomycetales bacterium]|nr:winged helix-turn-helix transcriptional regulator [Actinomycetales bacterium]